MTLKQEITRILAEEPADHRTLYSYLERNPSTVRKELSRLKAQGKIVRHSTYWHLSESNDQAERTLKLHWEPFIVVGLIIGAYLLGRLHGGL